MTDPRIQPPSARRTALRPAGLAAALLLGLWLAAAMQAFTPDLPHAGLDASWVAVMGEAADRGLHWGRDLAFTYGPASTLVTHYGNDAYLPVTLPLLLASALLFAGCALRLASAAADATSAALFAATLALALVTAGAGATPDAVFLVMPLLPALLVLSRRRLGGATVLLAAATAAALGAVGLAKMSYPAAALPVMLVADATRTARGRVPLLILPFAAGFLAGDLAYGQSLSDLPGFLRLQGEVVAGYSEAMALPGSLRELAAFLATAAALWLAAAASGRWGMRWRARAPAAACLAWVLFMLFKAGFVRQDLHTLIAWNGLALAAVVLALDGGWRPAVARATLALAVAGSLVVGLVGAGLPTGPSAAKLRAALAVEQTRFVATPVEQAAAAAVLLGDLAGAPGALRRDREGAWRDAAAADPLPALDGGVDTIPSVQNAVLAAGLDYRPRPSFQEYSTYTDGLLAANRDFLESPRAPAWVLVGREPGADSLTIDGRYPSLAEGSLWPDLLALYRPERRIGDLLALHRRASPLDLHRGTLRRGTARLGEEVPVDGEAPAVFATVDLRPTLLGRIAGLLFRPALSSLDVTLADGTRRSYRFVSGIGRSGFVLSPLVTDADDFAALAEAAPTPPGRRVVAFAVSGNAAFLARDLSYTLQPMAPAPPAGPAPSR